MEVQIQYITSPEALRTALIDALKELKIIQPTVYEMKAPATRQQACKFLNISLPTLDKLTKSGQIKAYGIGRQIRINWAELEKFVEHQETT